MNCAEGSETSVIEPLVHLSPSHAAGAGAPVPVARETNSYGPPVVLLASATGSDVGSFKAIVGSTLSSRPITGSQSCGGGKLGLGAGGVGGGGNSGRGATSWGSC